MATTLRKLIELLGVESKLGKTRLAEITALFEAREKVKAPKNGAQKSVTSSQLSCGKQR